MDGITKYKHRRLSTFIQEGTWIKSFYVHPTKNQDIFLETIEHIF